VTDAKGAYSFGQELRWCQLDGIRISETLMPAGLRLSEHAHNPGQICFILEGEYRERAGGLDHCFHPGALQFHAPGEAHSNQFSSESDVLALLISIDPDRWIRIATPRPVTSDAMLRNCASEIRRELGTADEAARVALEAWSMLSLSLVARGREERCDHEPPWLHSAVALIERKLGEPLSLQAVATAAGVHRATLAAAFRRFRNVSVGEWIREQRVRGVRHALVSSKKPLCEIATEFGFCDQAHMGRVFRSRVGLSPGDYRLGRR
jgi:AraC family transcriptional regulator